MAEMWSEILWEPHGLRAIPTLETKTPAEGVVWELKSVTKHTKFWVCTAGTGGEGGQCGAYTAGRVIAESLTPDPKTGEREIHDYGAEDVAKRYRFDYITMLRVWILSLERQQKAEFTNDRANEIAQSRRDFNAAMRALGFGADRERLERALRAGE
jgi:hypothetical protein